jgi:hypothetical protein
MFSDSGVSFLNVIYKFEDHNNNKSENKGEKG